MSTRATSQSVEFDQLFLEAGQCGKTVQQHGNSTVAVRADYHWYQHEPPEGYEENTPVAFAETILEMVDDRGDRGLNVMGLR